MQGMDELYFKHTKIGSGLYIRDSENPSMFQPFSAYV